MIQTEKRDVSHDKTVVEILRNDPEFANEYLSAALEDADLPGGQAAFLAALRHVVDAQGLAAVASRAGMPRESLYRALGPHGNPTIKTVFAIMHSTGLRLNVSTKSAQTDCTS